MRVCSVVGARPQFIKASVVSRALAHAGIEELLVHTGQHYDRAMSDAFFSELQIPGPAANLNVGSASHAAQTASILQKFESFLQSSPPVAGVIVYGDTNSTLGAALAAAKLNLPVFHVEAGLRSYNRSMPEELNRIVTDRLSSLLFCPTPTAVANLKSEGMTDGLHLVGDVMYEAVSSAANADIAIDHHLPGKKSEPFYVATIHRASNTDSRERLAGIVNAFGKLDHPVVFPVHPRTRVALEDMRLPENVHVIEPAGHTTMVRLVSESLAVLTDSGGLQKEAYWLGVPCVTLRAETEWVETLAGGWNQLAGWDPDAIVAAVGRRPSEKVTIDDDGNASEKIVAAIATFFGAADE